MSNVGKMSQVLNAYPVGSIYMSVNSTNPGELFGGTWEQIQGRFLLGQGSGYSAGAQWAEKRIMRCLIEKCQVIDIQLVFLQKVIRDGVLMVSIIMNIQLRLGQILLATVGIMIILLMLQWVLHLILETPRHITTCRLILLCTSGKEQLNH